MFPDQYLILVLEGSWDTAECLLHCSHHHTAHSTKHTVGPAPLGCILWYHGFCQPPLPPLLPPLSCRQPALHTPQFIKNPGYLGRDNTIVYLLQLPSINGLPLLILEWNFWQKTSIQKGKLL